MKRVFCVVYLLLMTIAVVDCLVRFGGLPPFGPMEWLRVFAASSVPAVLLSSVVFLAGDLFWLVCAPAVVWGAACLGMEWFFRSYFAGSTMVGEQLMVAIVTLSPEKVAAYVCETWTAGTWIVVVLAFAGVLVSVAWMFSRTIGRPTVRSFSAGFAVFAAMCLLMPRVIDDDHLTMALLDHEFVRGSDELTMYRELKEGGRPLAAGAYGTSESNLLAVIVIGESATRHNWSLYGYGRPTTPRLDAQAAQLLVLSNVTAEVALTPFAMRDLFTTRDGGDLVSLPSAAVSAGYETSLCSGQARTGRYEGSDELLFAACETRRYLCDLQTNTVCYDEQLVPLLRQAVAAAAPNRLVFVHTHGSHCHWSDRVPPSFAGFPEDLRDDEVVGLSPSLVKSYNNYDTSVRYTDKVLTDLLEVVRAHGGPAVFAYVSDHGESPRTVSRDHRQPSTHAVPCFFWFSDDYRVRHADRIARLNEMRSKSLTTKDLFSVWTELLGLRSR